MKRLWFAVIFLVICAAACFAEQHFIITFCNEMNKKIDTSLSYSQTSDERLNESIEDLKEYWRKHNDLIFTFTNHGVLDELSAHIRAIDEKNPDEGLRKAKASLAVFYENQRITFANIF